MPVIVDLEHLNGGYSVSRLPVDQPLPGWITGAGLANITYAPDEVSIVCQTDRVPPETETASGWSAIKISTKFGFDDAGVVLSVVDPISSAGLGVFVISTFYRDYLLVRTGDLARVERLLLAAGHQFLPLDNAVTVRIAVPADAESITGLHVRIWRETYANTASADAINVLNTDHRRPIWDKILSSPKPHQQTLVAIQKDSIVGFVCFGSDGPASEIKHLYVDPVAKRMGIGADLLSRVFTVLGDAGFRAVTLAVEHKNKAAQAFYLAQGGRITGQETDPGPVWKSTNLIFEWSLPRPKAVDQSPDR